MKESNKAWSVGGLLLLSTFFVLHTAQAVTVTVQTSSGASTSATYYTRDGDWATGDATISSAGAIEHTTSGSVEKGLIRAESGGGDRAFTPYTGNFSATANAGGGGASSSAGSANPRVDIFVVTQPGNSTLDDYGGATTYDTIGTAVGAANGEGGLPDWILVDQGTGTNTYTEQVAINAFEANSAITSVWGRDDTTIDAGGAFVATIDVDNSPSFTIDGFTVTGGSDGINVDNSPDAQILCNTVANNREDGIDVNNSAGITIRNNNVTNNGPPIPGDQGIETNITNGLQVPSGNINSVLTFDGISVLNSPDAWITDNNVTNNRGLGISVSNSQGTRITNNNVTYNGAGAFTGSADNDAAISNINPAIVIGAGGIGVSLSNAVQITNNNVTNNRGSGISVSNSQGAQITNNNVTDNGFGALTAPAGNDARTINNFSLVAGGGISLLFCQDAYVANNNVTDNEGPGIFLEGSQGVQVDKNTIQDNRGIGIDVATSSDIQITRNTITDNGFGAIENLGGIALGPTTTGVTIHQNNIAQNRDYGLWNGSANDVDASNNWWGPGTGGPGPSYDDTPPFPAYVDIRDQGNVNYSNWATTAFPLP